MRCRRVEDCTPRRSRAELRGGAEGRAGFPTSRCVPVLLLSCCERASERTTGGGFCGGSCVESCCGPLRRAVLRIPSSRAGHGVWTLHVGRCMSYYPLSHNRSTPCIILKTHIPSTTSIDPPPTWELTAHPALPPASYGSRGRLEAGRRLSPPLHGPLSLIRGLATDPPPLFPVPYRRSTGFHSTSTRRLGASLARIPQWAETILPAPPRCGERGAGAARLPPR